MRSREAAPPERDIFEDDTETADFQLKLRHMNSSIQSTETINEITIRENEQESLSRQNLSEAAEELAKNSEDDDDDDPELLGSILTNFPIRQSR